MRSRDQIFSYLNLYIQYISFKSKKPHTCDKPNHDRPHFLTEVIFHGWFSISCLVFTTACTIVCRMSRPYSIPGDRLDFIIFYLLAP